MLGKDCKINWEKRYSLTDETDIQGRWARVGWLKNKSNSKSLQIAWIKKFFNSFKAFVYIGSEVSYTENFKTLEEAKMFCEISLNRFKNEYL